MLCRVLAVLAVVATTAPAMAEQRYDRKIEQAAVRIVAARIGAIRGGFERDERPVFVRTPNPQPARRARIRRIWLNGGRAVTLPVFIGAWNIRT